MIARETRQQLERALPEVLPELRWFGAKARKIKAVQVTDWIPFVGPFGMLLVTVKFEDRGSELYALPLSLGGSRGREYAPGVRDAAEDPEFQRLMLEILRERAVFKGSKGQLKATGQVKIALIADSRLRGGEQSNSSVLYGDRYVLKLFRRLCEGVNPDIEVSKHLTESAQFRHSPKFLGAIEYRSGTKRYALGSLQQFVSNEGNAWEALLGHLNASGLDSGFDFGKWARLLGKRTLEMHLALAKAKRGERDFTPAPFAPADRKKWVSSLKRHARSVIAEFKASGHSEAQHLAALEGRIQEIFAGLVREPLRSKRIRVHGDYHLGQVLWTGKDFVILDFEGEPARPLSERRAKQSPLRDVAGMLRSFHYASHCCQAAKDPARQVALHQWYGHVAEQFLKGYFASARGKAKFLPGEAAERERLLKVYLLEKALYELSYEMNHRPDWIAVPLSGIFALLEIPK